MLFYFSAYPFFLFALQFFLFFSFASMIFWIVGRQNKNPALWPFSTQMAANFARRTLSKNRLELYIKKNDKLDVTNMKSALSVKIKHIAARVENSIFPIF